MTRQSTGQAAQRARITARRKKRVRPLTDEHGGRSQSGIKIRSRAAWQAYLAYQKIVRAENRKLDAIKAEWRKRAAEKGNA